MYRKKIDVKWFLFITIDFLSILTVSEQFVTDPPLYTIKVSSKKV